MLLCGFGCAWLGELVPQIVPVAKYVGAAYILYLAYRTLMRSPGAKKEAGPSGKPLSYVNGFLLQFLNVHILMLGIAAYSGYIHCPMGIRCQPCCASLSSWLPAPPPET